MSTPPPKCGFYDFVEDKNGAKGIVTRCSNDSDYSKFNGHFVWKDPSGKICDNSKDEDSDKSNDRGPFNYPRGDLEFWYRCADHFFTKSMWLDSIRDRKAVVDCILPLKGEEPNFSTLVTLIAGHTGCGKTVGTPLFLVEAALDRRIPCSFYLAVVTITYTKYFQIYIAINYILHLTVRLLVLYHNNLFFVCFLLLQLFQIKTAKS